MNIAIKEPSCGLCDESLFYHGDGVGKNQLEYMSSGFNVDSECQGIFGVQRLQWVKSIIVFRIKGNPVAELYPISEPKGKNVVWIRIDPNGIVVDICRTELNGNPRG